MNGLTKLSLSVHALCFALCVGAAAQAAGPEEAREPPLRKAQRLDQAGLGPEAQFYYALALIREPRNVTALSSLGLLQVRMNQAEAAQVQLERLQRTCAKCRETAQLQRAIVQSGQIGSAEPVRAQP